MMLELKPSFYIIFLSILFLGCQHELNFEGNQGSRTAIFSFDGSQDTCVHAIVAGSYKTGTPMGITNVVSITVTVVAAGTYTISTAVINGIKFTTSGTFTTTGTQSISLTASGTPVTHGTFSFTPGLNGCSFHITISNSVPISSAAFTYNGAPGSCTNASVGGNYTVGKTLNESHKIRIDVNVLRAGNYSISTAVVNGISFSGSDNLSTPGYGVVELVGTGTPIAEGVFSFTPSNNGCPFPIRVSL